MSTIKYARLNCHFQKLKLLSVLFDFEVIRLALDDMLLRFPNMIDQEWFDFFKTWFHLKVNSAKTWQLLKNLFFRAQCENFLFHSHVPFLRYSIYYIVNGGINF